jgi:hypothetical protein
MPTFQESNNDYTLRLKAYYSSYELMHVSRHSSTASSPAIMIVVYRMVTIENETPYIISFIIKDIGFRMICFQYLSITGEATGDVIENNIDEFIRNQE